MRLRAIASFAALLPLLCFAQDKVHMRIFVNGSPLGENVYEKSADGAYSSKSTIDLGSIKILATATGHVKDGKLVDAQSETSTPAGKSTMVFAKGRVDVTAQGKTTGAPWKDKSGTFGANLHPQFFASSLLAAEKALQNGTTKTVTVNAFFVDSGVVVPMKVTVLPAVTVEVAGSKVSARRFAGEVFGAKLDFFMDGANHIVGEDVPEQHLRFVADGWDGAFVDPITKFPELSQATYKTKTDKAVHVRMRDGTELICDIVRPDDNDKHPAILVRTPYGRGSELTGSNFYASRGYAYVVQDCRGREDSYGQWDPFVNEGPDGYDTIQWIAGMPWSNGKVGMIGGSYAGYVQWAAAVLNPPALKCIVPQVSPPDAMRNIPYDHGVFFLYGDLWWAKIVSGRRADFTSLSSSLPHPERLNTLPLEKLDKAVLGEDLEFFGKWLSRPTMAEWKGMDFTYYLSNATVPALHVSGIWDGDEIGTHINWNTMRELKRDNQWIIFGPWVHAFNTTHSFGDVEYGEGAIIDLDSVFLRWFDTWLKDKPVGMDKVPRVKLFVTGANKWVDLADWPDSTMPARTLYFSKGKLAPTLGKAETTGYTYDPAKDNKVPDEILHIGSGKPTTKVNAKTLKSGVFLKTDPFEKDTAITGPMSVKIHFTTSALDTDFFVNIVDIAPNGEARILGQPGKIRASYLGGMDAVRPLSPGKEYIADVTPWDFAHEFKKGHRIGVLVNSSMFPSFARNLGTAESIKTATRMIAQKNTILMGEGHPSSLTFHVLWEKP